MRRRKEGKQMNEARVFEDSYSGVFREQEDFFSCLHEILGNSYWNRQKVRNLRLVPITAGSKLEKNYAVSMQMMALTMASLRIRLQTQN